ncbi:hypothetical protein G6F46_015016 [Rhizopus delemar]|nr:hypothetical protein G6F46_015016 [Rhizopus delemar]
MSACAPATGSAGRLGSPGNGSVGSYASGRSQKSFCGSTINKWTERGMAGFDWTIPEYRPGCCLFTRTAQGVRRSRAIGAAARAIAATGGPVRRRRWLRSESTWQAPDINSPGGGKLGARNAGMRRRDSVIQRR